jgi:hypothetical protein
VNFPDDAFQKGFVSLAMTAKQSNLSGVKDIRNIVGQLQEYRRPFCRKQDSLRNNSGRRGSPSP